MAFGQNNIISYMNSDLYYIVISTFIIGGISLYEYHKNKYLSLGNLYLFFYTVVFAVAIKLYIEDDQHDFKNLNLFGFLHFIFFITLFSLPLLRIPRHGIRFVETNPNLVKFLYWFTIIFSLYGLSDTIMNLPSGVMSLFMNSDYGYEAFSETRAAMDEVKSGGRVINVISVFAVQANWLSVFLFLYSLIDRYSTKLEKRCLAFCLIARFLNSLSIGSRFFIIVPGLQFLFFYFFIRKFIPQSTKKIVNKGIITFGVLIIMGFFAITVSRASNTNREDSMFLLYDAYLSEGVLFYDKFAVDHGQNREGDRIFPFVKKALGFSDVADSYIKRTTKYTRMKINEVNFITFVGDFMLDFGFVLGNIILFIYVAFYNFALRRLRIINFSNLCVIYMLIVTLNGFSHYIFTYTAGNLSFIFFLFLYFVTRNSNNSSRKYDLQQKQYCNTTLNV